MIGESPETLVGAPRRGPALFAGLALVVWFATGGGFLGPAKAEGAAGKKSGAPAESRDLAVLNHEIQGDEERLGRIEARLALERDREAKGRLRTESLLSQLDRYSARLAVEDQRLRLLDRKLVRSKIRHRMTLGKFRKLRREQEGRRQNLRVRLRSLYMGGSAGNVRLIVMSRSLWDLIDRWSLVARLVRHDKKLIRRYREAEEVLRRLEARAAAEVNRRKRIKNKQALTKRRVARFYARRYRRLRRLEKNKARRRRLMRELENDRDDMRDAIVSLMKTRNSRIDRDAALFDKMQGRLPWPVTGRVLLAGRTRGSRGIRIRASLGSLVKSVAPGEVVYSDWVRGYGRMVILRHGEGIYTVYGGAGKVLVRRGEKVGPGQAIARVGTTGVLGDPALYFEIRRGSIPLEPMRWLSPRP